MVDYTKARDNMVEGQLRTNDVTDRGVLAAMAAVPRELFVPASRRPLAYFDGDLALTAEHEPGRRSRYLCAPMVLGRLLQAAEIGPADIVLDIGCGTGYSSAVLSHVAGSVVALEEDDDLAAAATATLVDLGIGNVAVVTGPLTQGWTAEAPYDVVVIAGAVETLPASIVEQMKPGGRLVVVEGRGKAARAIVYRRHDGDLGGRVIMNAAAPLLPGFERPEAFQF